MVIKTPEEYAHFRKLAVEYTNRRDYVKATEVRKALREYEVRDPVKLFNDRVAEGAYAPKR